jgi:hypothetical protein
MCCRQLKPEDWYRTREPAGLRRFQCYGAKIFQNGANP